MDQLNAVTEQVKSLYNAVPYAAYGEDYFPVVKSLGLSREEFKNFARGKTALEVGCGGGQLSLFLANNFDQVTAVDISTQSLAAAQTAAVSAGVNNARFIEANLFEDGFISAHAGQFDFVLCYGVLHHTHNPKDGYRRLSQLLKPSGILIVGLYSRTEWAYRIKRKIVVMLAGKDFKKRESIANRLWFGGKGDAVRIADGFIHPQVSFHSVGEVYGWVVQNQLSYIGSWPPIELVWYLNKLLRRSSLKSAKAGWLSRGWFFLVECLWLLSGKSVMVSVAAKK